MLLYAQAAAGPEYAYPACLLGLICYGEHGTRIHDERSNKGFTALDGIRFLCFADFAQPFVELFVKDLFFDRVKD